MTDRNGAGPDTSATDTGSWREASRDRGRWWERLSKPVLAAGAVATALGAILALWPDEDPQDKVSVSDLRITRLALSDFQGLHPQLEPQGGSAEAEDGDGLRITMILDSTSKLSPTGDAEPTLSPTDDAEPTLSPTDDAEPKLSPDPPAPLISLPVGDPPPDPSETYLEDVADVIDKRMDRLPPSDDLDGVKLVNVLASEFVGQDGRLKTPEDAARDILNLLRFTQTQPGVGDTLEPLGQLLTADVEVSGLRGKSLFVFWTVLRKSGREP